MTCAPSRRRRASTSSSSLSDQRGPASRRLSRRHRLVGTAVRAATNAKLSIGAIRGTQPWLSLRTAAPSTSPAAPASPGTTSTASVPWPDNPASENDHATVAYKIATGAQLWVSRFTGLGNSFDQANALAVNPKGGAVYVTGSSSVGGVLDFATVAYRAG